MKFILILVNNEIQKFYNHFQIISGILFLIIGKWNFNEKGGKRTLNKLTNWSTLLIFCTTVLNVLINIFAIPEPKQNKQD